MPFLKLWRSASQPGKEELKKEGRDYVLRITCLEHRLHDSKWTSRGSVRMVGYVVPSIAERVTSHHPGY